MKGTFRLPADLSRTETPPRRVLVVGSCLSQGLVDQLQLFAPVDHVLFNNAAELRAAPPQPVECYDFQVLQIPARTILPEAAYFRLPYTQEAWDGLFEECLQRLIQCVDAIMRWNEEHGLLTFVCNFIRPQQNQHGRLLSWHDKRSLPRLFDRLNTALSEQISKRKNAYILDCDEIVASFGRRYFQDDVVTHSNHASSIADDDPSDHDRLHLPTRIDRFYPNQRGAVFRAFAEEAVAMFRTVRGDDAVKLVIVDLDDTLWRGVVVENWRGVGHATEGYPLGFAEALLALKARGILLAIVSKNDETRVTPTFEHVWHKRLSFDDFAVRKINWEHKIENVAQVIREVNVRPDSVVFIDDNPAEREAVKAAFPDIRVLGDEPYLIRRILLWSAETQVAHISDESATRTSMVQAQVQRETARAAMSKEQFLASLEIRTQPHVVVSTEDPRFQRSLELLNKTNQFNTSGKRWTLPQCLSAFAQGMFFYTLDVTDKYTPYGLVAVGVGQGTTIMQFVMSCRVLGLGVELEAVRGLTDELAARGAPEVTAAIRKNQKNNLCWDLYERAGFALVGDDVWTIRPQAGTD